jgi:hypothetical protein
LRWAGTRLALRDRGENEWRSVQVRYHPGRTTALAHMRDFNVLDSPRVDWRAQTYDFDKRATAIPSTASATFNRSFSRLTLVVRSTPERQTDDPEHEKRKTRAASL